MPETNLGENSKNARGATMENRRKSCWRRRKIVQSEWWGDRKNERFRQYGEPQNNPRMPGASAQRGAAGEDAPKDSRDCCNPFSRTVASLSRGRFLEA